MDSSSMRLSRSLQKSVDSVISCFVKRSKRTLESSLSLSRISLIFWPVFSISFLSLSVRAACQSSESLFFGRFFSRMMVRRTPASSLHSCNIDLYDGIRLGGVSSLALKSASPNLKSLTISKALYGVLLSLGQTICCLSSTSRVYEPFMSDT